MWPPVEYPVLALLPVLVFGSCAVVHATRPSGRRVDWRTVAPALAWAAYAVYEWRMSIWTKTVHAPIRVDLLLIIPVLIAALVVGAYGCIRTFEIPGEADPSPEAERRPLPRGTRIWITLGVVTGLAPYFVIGWTRSANRLVPVIAAATILWIGALVAARRGRAGVGQLALPLICFPPFWLVAFPFVFAWCCIRAR